jgi:hypothetical protein
VVPVIVTAAFAKARPAKVPPVVVMAAPARIFPWNTEVVNVAAALTCQNTLHAFPPLAMTTLKFFPVSAPAAWDPTLKIQGPFPVSVNTLSVNVTAAGKQMTPEPTESGTPVKAAGRMVSVHVCVSASYALLKSGTTIAGSGEVAPEIVLPTLVSAPVRNTFPVMVESVKVTAPEEPTFPVMVEPVVVTAPPAGGPLRTTKSPAVFSGGAAAANAVEAPPSSAAVASKHVEKYF